jgi:hypothetical protein
MRWALLLIITGCSSPQQPTYQKRYEPAERPLQPVSATVVEPAEAARSGLVQGSLSIPFTGGTDGTRLVEGFLDAADKMRAPFVTDVAIYFQMELGGEAVECRSMIVPETITEQHTLPAHYQQISVSKPVTRTVTESEQRCNMVTKYESVTKTEYVYQCHIVNKPVTRTRTVYSSQYDYSCKCTRQVPRTETYTAYEMQNECKSEPVTRTSMQPVTKNECSSHPVTKTVTRYEFQFESRYVPARLELITRQRLRELDPECYVLPATPPSIATRNRIEGRVFKKP